MSEETANTNLDPEQIGDNPLWCVVVRVKVTKADGAVEHYSRGEIVPRPPTARPVPGGDGEEAAAMQHMVTANPAGVAVGVVEAETGAVVMTAFIVVDQPFDPIRDRFEATYEVHIGLPELKQTKTGAQSHADNISPGQRRGPLAPPGLDKRVPPPSLSLRGRQWREAFEEMQVSGERTLRRLFEQENADQPKRQHFIPRFWLDCFADKGNAAVLDVAGPKAARSTKGVRAIAVREDFYTLKAGEGEDGYWVERFLGWIDNEASNPGRWESLKIGEMVADPLSRLFVAQFLVAQMLRGPGFRQVLKSLAEVREHDIVSVGWAAEDIPPTGSSPQIEATQELLVGTIATMMADHVLPRQLVLRRWGLCEAPDETGWALPLEPVVGLPGIAPLSSPVIWVPVSRRFLLTLNWDYTFSAHEEPKAVTLTQETAARIRREIIAHAQRQPIADARRLIVHPNDAGRWQGWCFGEPT